MGNVQSPVRPTEASQGMGQWERPAAVYLNGGGTAQRGKSGERPPAVRSEQERCAGGRVVHEST